MTSRRQGKAREGKARQGKGSQGKEEVIRRVGGSRCIEDSMGR
jgi:hypothetical protein